MAEVRFLPPAAKYLKKLKDKRLKELYKVAIDDIYKDYTIGEPKTCLLYTSHHRQPFCDGQRPELQPADQRESGQQV